MDRSMLSSSSQENKKNKEGLEAVVEHGTLPSTRSSNRNAKTSPEDTNKRKVSALNDSSDRDSGQKRTRRTDHLRPTSSSQMDSIATVGRLTQGSTPNTDHDHEANDPNETPTAYTESVISQYVDLHPLPDTVDALPPLTNAERKELERYLEFSKDETWREDWMGNLAFADKEIYNPDGKSRERSKKPLFVWAEKGKVSLKLLNNLVRHVYNLEEVPLHAKKILAHADPKSVTSVQEAVRRISYDPVVLENDGWTTVRSSEPIGASGGPHRIGDKVFWQGYEGIVIAYVHDNDMGDLWKAMWLEELDTFDLEAEELEDARRRFERKMKQKEQQAVKGAGSVASTKQDTVPERRSGKALSADFHVEGIEHGIILAVSFSRGARPGVFWPARVMHFSELQNVGSQKRLTMKHKLDVVFLAPYWNTPTNSGNRNRSESYADTIQKHGNSIFNAGPLFELESIDASPESIQAYPYDPDRGLDLDELSSSFRFAGLPKAAFSRFVQSHRLALGLKTYSQKIMQSTVATEIDKTTASLFEAHPLAGQTPRFPDAVLHLPFEFILSHLPPVPSGSEMSFSQVDKEPALQIGVILEAMKPPTCWGQGDSFSLHVTKEAPESQPLLQPFASPTVALSFEKKYTNGTMSVDPFLAGLDTLANSLGNPNESMSKLLVENLNQLLSKVPAGHDDLAALSLDDKKGQLRALVRLWIMVKTHGEELISSSSSIKAMSCLLDWRLACERIYKHITLTLTSEGFGNGLSWVLSDTLCNLHVTSNECFERAVRIPAAMKAVKQVAADNESRLKVMQSVRQRYLEIAEKEVIRRAHTKTYLRRIKKKCDSVNKEGEIVALTADSDNHGGEDTKGTKGSWTAAITAVAASIQAVDMIMNGECVNVFCLTRPPGHHAGRELHPMKAVSNGFCLLNNAACAALYATAPVLEGGPGLRRVCVIDIDVHHGNGTQDILCSTYDPRFLYVSIHAGGPDVNGVDPSGEEAEQFSHHLARTPKKGIYPGRCGDFSPHPGVLNIPLGPRVTSHALGAALMTKVTPAVEKFSPELIIISAGFDAHKNDPLGLGGLSAEDFGTLTEVICKLAHRSCGGRVVSILEGGYGVPCCREPTNLFDPDEAAVICQTVTPSVEGDGLIGTNGHGNVTTANHDGNTVQSTQVTSKPPESTMNPAVSKTSEPPIVTGSSTGGEIDQQRASNSKFGPPLKILDLGDDLPENMKDEMPYLLMKRLDKCHAEGFMDCVREHVAALAKCNLRI